ncbi:MAG: NIF3-like protein [Micavibrio sp.]|nr:NIF3-like protein [Micavibrio sp.]
MPARYKLSVNVPVSHADAVRKAIGDAGAGRAEHYSHCSFSLRGMGRFTPIAGASPYIGQVGVAETVEEEQIQTDLLEADIRPVLAAMRAAHPYEEIGFELVRLVDTDAFL